MMPLYLRVPVKTLAVAIALALVGGTHAQQTIYYVDPLRGDDSSSGTSLSESFQSLARAVQKKPEFPPRCRSKNHIRSMW